MKKVCLSICLLIFIQLQAQEMSDEMVIEHLISLQNNDEVTIDLLELKIFLENCRNDPLNLNSFKDRELLSQYGLLSISQNKTSK